MTASQKRMVHQIARQTRKLKNEQYRVIDPEGHVIFERKGEAGRVSMTNFEKSDSLRGRDAISIHNHPGEYGGAFSAADLRDFGYGARAIVVVSNEGNYYLINKNFRKRNQYDGWMGLQEGLKSISYHERSILDLKRDVEKRPKVARLTNELNRISSQWVKARAAGKPQSVLDSLQKKYADKAETLKKVRATEELKMQVENLHRYYRENARKYGFSYVFIKGKK